MIRCEGKSLYIDDILMGVIYHTDIVSKKYWLFYQDANCESYQLTSENRKLLRRKLKEFKDKIILHSNTIDFKIRKY